MAYQIGTAFLEVLPDLAGFGRSLNSGVSKAKATAKVPVLPDADGLSRKMADAVAGATRGTKATIEADTDTRKFKDKLEDGSESAGKKGGSRFKRVFESSLGKIAIGSAIGAGVSAAVGGIKDFASGAIGEAKEAVQAGKTTEAIIKATGGAAKISSAQISEYAGALSSKIGVDDEAIQAGQNLLLTFKGVKNEGAGLSAIFDRATSAGADLAAAGFGSIEGNAKMLGKALNDPTKGMTALTRAGVTFSQKQKDQIKAMQESGDLLGAQKIILKEVESQVGGTAEATATNADKMKVSWGNLQELVGTKLMPVLEGAAAVVVEKIIPAVSSFADQVGPKLSEFGATLQGLWPTIEGLFSFIGNNLGVIAPLAVVITGIVIAFNALTVAMSVFTAIQGAIATAKAIGAAIKGWTVVQWLLNAAMSANPIGIVIVILAALVGAIILAYNKSETFRNIVQAVWKGIQVAISFAWNNVIKPVLDAVVHFFTVIVPNAAGRLLEANDRVFNQVVGIVRGFGNSVGDVVGKIVGFFTVTVPGAFNTFKDKGIAAVRGLRDKFGEFFSGIKRLAAIPINFVIETIYNNGIRTLVNKVIGVFGGTELPSVDPIKGFAAGGVLPGWSPGRDIHQFSSPTGGNLALSGGEAIMRPEFTRAVGGAAGVAALNAASRKGDKERIAMLLGAGQHHADGGLVSFKGGRFTDQFANALRAVAKGHDYSVFQGGWRPATSYSGTSHAGDAIDAGPVSAGLVRAFRDVGIAAWDRTGMGNWAPHIHGVPLPGVGAARGSAVWQAQDYLNGGNGLNGRDNGAGSGYRPTGVKTDGGGFTFPGAAIVDLIASVPGVLNNIRAGFEQMVSDSGFGQLLRDTVRGVMNQGVTWVNDKIPGDGPLPSFARGGAMAGSGLAQINERGGELVQLANGTRVYPANGPLPGGQTSGLRFVSGQISIDEQSRVWIAGVVREENAQDRAFDGMLTGMGR